MMKPARFRNRQQTDGDPGRYNIQNDISST